MLTEAQFVHTFCHTTLQEIKISAHNTGLMGNMNVKHSGHREKSTAAVQQYLLLEALPV